jgi:hypothetical protein
VLGQGLKHCAPSSIMSMKPALGASPTEPGGACCGTASGGAVSICSVRQVEFAHGRGIIIVRQHTEC